MGENSLILKEDLIELNLQASDWTEALTKMAKHLQKEEVVKDSFAQAIVDREKIYPTGLQSSTIGVAIPHTDSEHVNVQAIYVATLEKPVTFVHMGTDDMEVPVEVIFMLAIKDPNAQLTLLQKLMDILQKEEVLEGIKNSKTKSEILALLNQELL